MSSAKSGKVEKYPKSAIVLLIMNVLQGCAFLVFYISSVKFWTEALNKSESYATTSTFIYTFLLNFTPLLTGFIADNYLGRYYMTLIHMIFFFIGFGCMASASLLHPFYPSLAEIQAWMGLIFIAVGTGINKSVVPIFNADQFTENHSHAIKNKMFSWYYIAVNVGGLITMYVIANQKDIVTCFGKPCYPLMYMSCMFCIEFSGILFSLFNTSLLRPKLCKNVVVESFKCLVYALSTRKNSVDCSLKEQSSSERKTAGTEKEELVTSEDQSVGDRNDESSLSAKNEEQPTGTFLDRAFPKYDRKFIRDVLQVLLAGKMFIIGIPFWSCYVAMIGYWDFQFGRLNGQIGRFTLNFQSIITINPLLCITFVFLLSTVILPLINRFIKVTLLRKMGCGGFFTFMSYVCVIWLQYQILADDINSLSTGSQIVVWKQDSVKKCTFRILNTKQNYSFDEVELEVRAVEKGQYEITSNCSLLDSERTIEIHAGHNIFAVYPNTMNTVRIQKAHTKHERITGQRTLVEVITCRTGDLFVNNLNFREEYGIDRTPKLSAFLFEPYEKELRIGDSSDSQSLRVHYSLKDKFGSKTAIFDNTNCEDQNSTASLGTVVYGLVPPFRTSGLLMIPQISFGALAEALLAVGAIEFGYMQTSSPMKAVMQAVWLLTAALGSIFSLIVNECGFSKLHIYYIHAAAMLIGTVVFLIMSLFYKYIDEEEE